MLAGEEYIYIYAYKLMFAGWGIYAYTLMLAGWGIYAYKLMLAGWGIYAYKLMLAWWGIYAYTLMLAGWGIYAYELMPAGWGIFSLWSIIEQLLWGWYSQMCSVKNIKWFCLVIQDNFLLELRTAISDHNRVWRKVQCISNTFQQSSSNEFQLLLFDTLCKV